MLSGQLDVPASFNAERDAGTTSPARTPVPPGIVIVCHGLMNHRDSHVSRSLAALASDGGTDDMGRVADLSRVICRFDFRGNGRSGGDTAYGNYEDEARDLNNVVRYLAREHVSRFGPILAIAGHSKAASVVTIWAAQHARACMAQVSPCFAVPLKLILLSGRFDMSKQPHARFSAQQLELLDRDGRFLWKWMTVPSSDHAQATTQRPYYITKGDLQRRASIDMAAYVRCVRSDLLATGMARVLIVHGTADSVIPVADARAYAREFAGGVSDNGSDLVTESGRDDGADAGAATAARDVSCVICPATGSQVLSYCDSVRLLELEGADHFYRRPDDVYATLEAMRVFISEQ